MAEPIIETIAAGLKTAIDAITTANGFKQDLTGVRARRVDFETTAWADNTVLIKQTDGVPVDLSETPQGLKAWEQGFDFEVMLVKPATDSTAIETHANRAAADIMKKLRAAPGRGAASCWDTEITGIDMLRDDSGATFGVRVSILVRYRTNEDDPYN